MSDKAGDRGYASSGKLKMNDPISSPKLIDKWEYQHIDTTSESDVDGSGMIQELPLVYEKVQTLVQLMLNSESGIPIRSHRNKLLSAVPSVFTGSDMINWLAKKFQCSKSEAVHVALLVYKHGYYYSVDKDEFQIKEDGSLFRFQTPHLWSSQNFDDSDYTYTIFLLKQLKRTKTSKGVDLADYHLTDLRRLQHVFKDRWNEINAKADDEVRVLREQRKIAKQLIICQERAFWRLRRPPPGERKVTDCFLTKFGITKKFSSPKKPDSEKELTDEIRLLNKILSDLSQKVTNFSERVTESCRKYSPFDPIIKTPPYGNPWTTNDDTYWNLERSIVEYPSERKLKKWACSLEDMLMDVTGRFNFESFCKKHYCSENIRFLEALQDLQMLPLEAVNGAVTMIHEEFIDPSAESMVNISAEAFTEAQQDLLNPTRFSFSLAQRDVHKLMETDIYKRYLITEHAKLLSTANNNSSVGKSFVKKFISRSSSNKSDILSSPDDQLSPCHPKRYTKRELNIVKKSDGLGSIGSLDNIFLATTNSSVPQPDHLLHPQVSERRISAPLIKYPMAARSPSPPTHSNLTISNSIAVPPSTKKQSRDTNGDNNCIGLSTLSEEGTNFETVGNNQRTSLTSDKRMKDNDFDDEKLKKAADSRKIRGSLILSRSLEDLAHLADEDDAMTMAMHRDTYQMGLMSLRTPPAIDQFNMFDVPQLDRKKSGNTFDLFNPETSLTPSIMTSFYGAGGRAPTMPRPSLASSHGMPIPDEDHIMMTSSNDSIHSAISVY